MNRVINPYEARFTDGKSAFSERHQIAHHLDSHLVKENPSCVSLIAERGMSGKAVVEQYLATREQEFVEEFSIVTCDVKSDLPGGACATDFYRDLVTLIWRKLRGLSAEANTRARLIAESTTKELFLIELDMQRFFRHLSSRDDFAPLLIIFYNFDRLPDLYTMTGGDWNLLRKLSDAPQTRVHYLIVSRRPLQYIEQTNDLVDSQFSTIFPPPIRLGLFSEAEIISLINETLQKSVEDAKWPDWLIDSIVSWGGGHPYCTEYICFHLFELIWNQRVQITENNHLDIFGELQHGLSNFFDRLYRNLEKDGLLVPLIYAVSGRANTSHYQHRRLLDDLGYFKPGKSNRLDYQLFSPLFHQYLVERGQLPDDRSNDENGQSPGVIKSDKVREILDLSNPDPDVRNWYEGYLNDHSRTQRDEATDHYVLMYLTGVYWDIQVEELNELRRLLFEQYFAEDEVISDKGSSRSTFYTKLKRWGKYYYDDSG